MHSTVVTIVGARPQFIKAAAVSRVLRAGGQCREILVHTGQHYDDNMSQVFFDELEIPTPDFHLGIGSGSHGAQTGRMLEQIEQVLLKTRPDWVLVYGDTNSTLAGALAAAKLHMPVAHVEAGLRSFNRRMPEELNRVAADHVSDLLLAPTEAAIRNLQREGIPDDHIHLVGDVMYDAALYYGEKAEAQSRVLQRLHLSSGNYVLTTIHRAENTDSPQRLDAIFSALCRFAADVPVVLPLHPRTRAALERSGQLATVRQSLLVIEPQGYLDMVMLEKHARLIATDSGGVQKEAYFHQVPCITLRDETEWVELVESGWNSLVPPTHAESIVERMRAALRATERPVETLGLYGAGEASQRISKLLSAAA